MNSTGFKIIMATLITAASFYAAYAAKSVKVVFPAPAHRIISLEYKAEAAVTNQLHKLKTTKKEQKPELIYQIMPSYSISLKCQNQGQLYLYKSTLTYPYTQRELLIQGRVEAPDQLSFP